MAENLDAARPSAQTNPVEDVAVVDERQFIRIEAVHRGFLYQHIYGAICLLLAASNGVERVIVERDEDVEIVLPRRRVYIQIKTRIDSLSFGDVEGALQRFEGIRDEHGKGARDGEASFLIASNAAPSGPLLRKIAADDWPKMFSCIGSMVRQRLTRSYPCLRQVSVTRSAPAPRSRASCPSPC